MGLKNLASCPADATIHIPKGLVDTLIAGGTVNYADAFVISIVRELAVGGHLEELLAWVPWIMLVLVVKRRGE